jgi:hypothetical protein
MLEAIGVIIGLLGVWLFLCDKRNGFAIVLMALGLVFLGIGSAIAQHVHPDETISDQRVSRFYDEWKRPPERLVSCCHRKDCYSAQIRRSPNGGLQYLHKWSGKWANIPASAIESNQVDPHDSPDTENHVCANESHPEMVYCAVFGSGL